MEIRNRKEIIKLTNQNYLIEIAQLPKEGHDEDRHFVNEIYPDKILFGIFDGLGGEPGGAKAASTCENYLYHIIEDKNIDWSEENIINNLTNIIYDMNKKCIEVFGMTTATIGIIYNDFLYYVHCGDCRFYMIDNFYKDDIKYIEITKDECHYNYTLCLGDEIFLLTQKGKVKLEDRILFAVSDGILGDFAPDILSEEDLCEWQDPFELIHYSTKKDDKTVIKIKRLY